MRIHLRHRAPAVLGALAILAFVASACVAEPGASGDPAASADPPASTPAATASPAPSPAGSATACPPLPLDPDTGAMVTTVEALAALGDKAAAACYGDAKLELRAYLPKPLGYGGIGPYTWSPTWLGEPLAVVVVIGERVPSMDDPARLGVHLPPAYGDCPYGAYLDTCPAWALLGTWVTIVAHYDDPAAATCVATPNDQIQPPAPPMPASEAQAWCARMLVADSVTPLSAAGPLPSVDPGLCPVEPITVDQLVEGAQAIGDQYGLGCFGGTQISFEAYVVPGVGLLSGMEQTTVEPRWLADSLNTGAVLAPDAKAADDATRWLVVRTPPDLPGDLDPHACDGSAVDPKSCVFAPYVGTVVTVTGHYNDYESDTCREVPPAGSDPLLDEQALIEYCREQFVVTAVEGDQAPTPSATPPVTSTR